MVTARPSVTVPAIRLGRHHRVSAFLGELTLSKRTEGVRHALETKRIYPSCVTTLCVSDDGPASGLAGVTSGFPRELNRAERRLIEDGTEMFPVDYRTDHEKKNVVDWRPTAEDAAEWGEDRTVGADLIHYIWGQGKPVLLLGCKVVGVVAWRPDVPIVFGALSAVFTDDVVFDGATFGNDAVFTKTTFTSKAEFGGATFTGDVQFDEATFSGDASFGDATFNGDAQFDDATFSGDAGFRDAKFESEAGFRRTTFTCDARFTGDTTFTGDAWFGHATFNGDAYFGGATFTSDASFGDATFTGDAWFHGATFTGDANFGNATFAADAGFDNTTFKKDLLLTDTWARSMNCSAMRATTGSGLVNTAGLSTASLDLSRAVFEDAVRLELSAKTITAQRIRIARDSNLRLRCAAADFTDADLGEHCFLEGGPPLSPLKGLKPRDHHDPEVARTIEMLRRDLDSLLMTAKITSLERTVVVGATLSGLDLTDCRFLGAHGLDRLRIDPGCVFADSQSVLAAPFGNRGSWMLTRRQVIADETWIPRRARSPLANQQGQVRQPQDVAEIYRALRKGLEDAKNEPGAADFYYGEMEMRRRGPRPGLSGRVEQCLLAMYWLLCGYGLRAWRAFAALFVLMLIGAIVFHSPSWAAITVSDFPADQPATVEIHPEHPALAAPGPPAPAQVWQGRITTAPPATRPMTWHEAAMFSLRESVALIRPGSDGRHLPKSVGTLVDFLIRIVSPVLLALALLAIRARTKR
jgi:hypothetical protein